MGFSDKPLDIQIGLTKEGIIAEAKLVQQVLAEISLAQGLILLVICLIQIQIMLPGFDAMFMFAIPRLYLLTSYQQHFS